MITFQETGIRPELVKAVTELGFEQPMPVQEKVIPVILQSSRDIIALAQTGTGKTAAFGLPLISIIDENSKNTQVLILCPTRELCLQITGDLTSYAKYIPSLRIVAVYGGASIEMQVKELRQGAHVIVATPGRMNDLIRRKKVNLGFIHSVVLDEADEMLNMGFKEDLNTILDEVPKERRTLLFSATMSKEISAIASQYMRDKEEITVGTKNAGSENVQHLYCMVHAADRYFALKRVVDFSPEIYGIIFCRTRHETKEVAEKLMKDGYSADALHGDLSQSQRDYVMQRFRSKSIQMLVATDVAARGLDVDDLTHVINYNLPDELEIYTHRSGRTGRAGKSGISISIIHVKEKSKIPLIERMIHKTFQYKPVPGGKEICEKQLYTLVDKMEKVEVNEAQIEEYLAIVYKKLEWMSREELIKRFVSAEFNRFLDYYKNAPDLNVKEHTRERRDDKRSPTDKRFTLFRINVGSMDGLTARDLIGLVNEFTRNRSIAIGKANILKQYSLFEADTQYTDAILSAFRKGSYEGRRIFVELAREREFERKEGRKDDWKSDKKDGDRKRKPSPRRY
jgi:ATP-dependent RNA helicase DeaD